jgi:predicted ester cyclase
MPPAFVMVASLPISEGTEGPGSTAPGTPELLAANQALGASFVNDLENAQTSDGFLQALTRVVSPGYIQHNLLVPPGRDGLASFSEGIKASFPDARATLREAWATTDRVAARWTFEGTLTGQPFLGIAATGQKVEFDIYDIWTVQSGQLFEHWDAIDWPRALVQLGVSGLPAAFVEDAAHPVNR